MLKALNKREKLILLFTGAIIIFTFIFKIVLDPVLVKNEALNREIKLTQLKLNKSLNLLSQKDYLRGEYAKISSNLNIEREEKDYSTAILSEIENLAKVSNLHIIDIRPYLQKNLSSYKESYVELRTEGNMENCLKFIYNIENSLALLEIKKFQLKSKPANASLEGNFVISQTSLDN